MKIFNSRRLIISGVLLLLVIALIIILNLDIFTYSRYEKEVTSQNSITTAVYLLDDTYQTINVTLPDVIPDNGQYKYKFSVKNFNDDAHCDTNLKYRIHIRTTTNLQITYNLFNTWDIDNATTNISNSEYAQDDYGTWFKHIYTDYKTMLYSEDKTDYYTLLLTFPTDYKSHVYSGIAELIEINVESKQILKTDV